MTNLSFRSWGPARSRRVLGALFAALLLSSSLSLALQPRTRPARFDPLARPEAGSGIGIAATPVRALEEGAPLRAAWERFSAESGGWSAWIDPRSGLPSLAMGRPIRWLAPGESPSLPRLDALARSFLDDHAAIVGAWGGSLELDTRASGPLTEKVWQVSFRHVVGGIPVQGARYDFQVSDGNLVAFGASRWAPVLRSTTPVLGVEAARSALFAYLGLESADEVVQVEPPSLRLVPVDPRRERGRAWDGPRGKGYDHLLVYRFAVAVPEEPATWVAEVDADTGGVLALFDDTRYGRVQGGVYPVSDDQICPSGCEQPAWPMPFADLAENGTPAGSSGDEGIFSCSPGSTMRTTLSGPYIRVHDNCGPVSETATCDSPLDLQQGPGTDCAVPAGTSPGNTHASRSSFYHLNRAMEKGRAWLPDNNWLKQQLTDNVNINSTCNAYWSGSVNFYRSGGGCRNTGEIAGVFVHEWGHGLDQNDGGNYDNPSEAYADVVAFFETRESCVGRGFFVSGNCSGYGNPCLDCTGIRDQDWNMRADHAPSSPSNFINTHCGGGSGPCGKETHCEGYLAGETVWDLATRDLPASGLDSATAWQLAEKMFYLSRRGSGGNAYNCAPPVGDGCSVGSWFQKFRLVDDDDGNLSNGTPHGAAIYSAFARHGIACGSASDPSNQSAGGCPTLAKPDLSVVPGSNDVQLSWTAVPGAASYVILRNDVGCERGQIRIAQVAAPATTYLDDAVSSASLVHYRVQPVGTNAACDGPVSECVSSADRSPLGAVRFDASAYGCGASVGLKVVDGNASGSVTVRLASDSETEPETVILQETLPGSRTFTGSVATAPPPSVHGDGVVALSRGDLLTVTYHDPDDGSGGEILAWTVASSDCDGPRIEDVRVSDVGDDLVVVRWSTSEPATGRVDWGVTPQLLDRSASSSVLSTTHALTVKPLDSCGRYHFRVASTDSHGNEAAADAAGAPFGFNASRIGGALVVDELDASTGWTLEGEWQIGSPQRKGTAPGDPAGPFRGAACLGHDLTGLGAHPGDYEPARTERAIGPVINASSLTHGQLRFRRWLNVTGGIASVEVKSGGVWNEVWNSFSLGGASESDWSQQILDISPWADGNPQLQIAFKQLGGPNGTYVRAGWNVDRLVVRDASAPEFLGCGGCGGSPAFAGAAGADDLDACADNGVRVRWQPAAAWGTGASGTYSVHRGSQPEFVPAASNRLAFGLSGASWIDASAPNGATLYYVVRAENDEACSDGPNNGGVVDGNAARASVSTTATRPTPAAVGGLRAALLNDVTVRLEWTAASGAALYRVLRSPAASAGFAEIGSGETLAFDDVGAGIDGQTHFYLVRGVNACGIEGP